MRRRGFTLVELLVVIGILLLMATLAIAVYSGSRGTDRMRSAARITQSAFLGAKDRAMHAKAPRGVRLVRDATTPYLVTGFSFVQPIQHDDYGPGSVQLERLDVSPADGSADGPDVLLVRAVNTDWNTAAAFFAYPGQIRIPASTGQWYQFVPVNNGLLQLATPYIGTAVQAMPNPVAVLTANASCDIQFANEALPFHAPISLPSGTVVDLRYCSINVQSLACVNLPVGSPLPSADVSFSPRGNVTGPVGGLGSLLLVLRDLSDATAGYDPSSPQVQGECLIVAVNPSTGLVQTYDADLTDANADGIVDNIFAFAQAGKAAGR